MDQMRLITKDEYLRDPGKWLRLSQPGSRQIGITGDDGRILIILGTGPLGDERIGASGKYFFHFWGFRIWRLNVCWWDLWEKQFCFEVSWYA